MLAHVLHDSSKKIARTEVLKRTRVSPDGTLEKIEKIEAERLVDPRVHMAKQEEEEDSANDVMEIDGGSDAEKPCPAAFSQSTVC